MIYNKYFESESKIMIVLNKLKKIFSLKNVVFIILSFVFSSQIFIGEYSQLSIVMLGVASVFNVPLLVVALPSAVGLVLGNITQSGISELIGIFIIFTLITAIVNVQGLSKKFEVLLKLMISVAIVEIITNFVSSTLVTNFFEILQNFFVIAIFYMIFVSGILVIINIGKGYVYSQEEKISMVAVCAMVLTIFQNITFYNVSVMNILLFVLILIFGWKNGAILGSVTGFMIGMLLTVVCNINIITVIMLAASGAIAGIFSKFGKIGVVVGFVLGNLYIIFYASGISDITIRITEMLVASTVLILLPKKIETKLKKTFDINNTLQSPYENVLDSASTTKERINAVSSIFDDLSEITVLNTEEEKKDFRKILKRYLLDYIECSCLNCEFKKECKKSDRINLIVEYILNKLENNEKIEKDIFADLECNQKEELIKGIQEIYSNIKIMKLLKQKEKENNKKISSQYKEVANILRVISKNIKSGLIVKDSIQAKLRDELKLNGYTVYEDEYLYENNNLEYTFVTNILTNIDKQKKQIINVIEQIMEQKVSIKLILNSSKNEKSRIKVVTVPKYQAKNIVISKIKDGEEISGDSYLSYELEDRKFASILSDGISSGKEASKSSGVVISSLEKLFKSGFEAEKSIEILNQIIKLKENEGTFATADICIIDLNTAMANFIKIGASPTYIISNDGKITTITSMSLPMGIDVNTNYIPISEKIGDGGIIIQFTDGVISDEMNPNDNYILDYLKTVDLKKNSKIIAEDINRIVLKNNKNILKDDMTISVTKIERNV